MMKAAPIIVGVASLAVGLVAGRFLARETPLPEQARETRHAGSHGTRATPPPSRTVEEKHDFPSLIERQRKSGGTAPEMQAKLETMSVEALMKLLAEVSARQGANSNEFLANSSTHRALARELYRRKGMGAIEEAEKEPDRNLRFMMTGAFIEVAQQESPVAAKEWMERRRKEYGIEYSFAGDREIIKGATLAGAAELIVLHDRYGKKWGKKMAFPGAEIPPDFDFALLVRHFPTEMNPGMKRAMTSWGVKDKEAAMAVMRGNIEQHGPQAAANFGAMIIGVAITDGNEKTVEWMMRQLDSLSEEGRKEALKSLKPPRVPDMQSVDMKDQTVIAIAEKLPHASERVEFIAGRLIQFNGNTESNIGMLRSLPSASEQEKALIQAMPRLQNFGSGPLSQEIDRYASALNFSAEARQRVETEMELIRK